MERSGNNFPGFKYHGMQVGITKVGAEDEAPMIQRVHTHSELD